jgi:leucyl aminopeptidase
MKFTAKTLNPSTQKTGALIIGLYTNGRFTPAAEKINTVSEGYLETIIKSGDLTGKVGEKLVLHAIPGISADRVIVVGCGEDDKVDVLQFVKIVRAACSSLVSTPAKDAISCLSEVAVGEEDLSWRVQTEIRAAGEIFYQVNSLKSGKPAQRKLKSYTVACDDRAQTTQASKAAKHGQGVVNGMQLSRDLANLPSNVCTPTYLGDQAKAIAKEFTSVKTKVLTEAQMEKLGMGSLLSVSQGSEEPAKLVIMEYKGGKASEKPIVLVGKGVTFDTGGISLKPGAGMDEMKYDMCGAASVMGTMRAVAEMGLSINLVVIVPTVENMPDGRATNPGDIVTSMSGQTIEILNTDAEGRLILCDALTYAERYKPKAIIDVATLTGACIVALGKVACGLLSNDDALAADLLAAGQQSGDRAWQMPLFDEYQQLLDSNFADIANIGGRDAGTITAACFLSRFTKNMTWAHLDIAGTAWVSGKDKGATGRPVPLLIQYLMNQA